MFPQRMLGDLKIGNKSPMQTSLTAVNQLFLLTKAVSEGQWLNDAQNVGNENGDDKMLWFTKSRIAISKSRFHALLY